MQSHKLAGCFGQFWTRFSLQVSGGAECHLSTKETPEKNQKQLLIHCMPCSDPQRPQTALQAALERGCDIPGAAKDSSALPPGAGADGAGWARQEGFPRQKGMCRARIGLLVAVGSASAASETGGLECFLL